MAGATAPVRDGLDQSKVKFVEIDGIRTRYYEHGTGDPLVLLHGGQFGSGYSLDAWSLVLPALAESFHVYALDKLGQGQTGNPKGDAYTFESLLDHTYGFLQAMGIRGAHLAGHSRGGLLIARLAQVHPEVAKSLIIIDSNTLAPEDPSFPSGEFYAEVARRTPPGPATRAAVRMEPEAQAFSTAHITDDFTGRLLANALLPVRVESDERMKTLANTVWMPSMGRAKAEALRLIDEQGLPVPTLIIWGQNDVSAPFRIHGLPLLDRIAAKTPRTVAVIVNQTGHYVMREQPDVFVRAVRGFCLD
ncbi:MAG TPA: alpha/beta hydrolase [Chloroflexota bacterium]|jgi:2-hydroxy-6-oxo-6-(2'-carboxyphenyl)-hexa-2,4-dienoate hydrolase